MESQKLETLSLRAVIDTSYFDLLKKENELWYTMGVEIEEKDSQLHLNKADTEQVQLYLDSLHKQRDALYTRIGSLESPAELEANLEDIIRLEDTFSETAGELYDTLEEIGALDISRLRNWEIIIAVFSLLLLWFEFQFIIMPVISELNRRKKELEELNESKDRILATVAHDIRNPLTGIKGMLGIMKEEDQNLSEESHEMIDLSIDSCDKAEKLIQELLDISLLESEDFHLETDLVHFEQYLRGVLTQFKPKAEQKNIELKLTINPKSLETSIDKHQFSRVIENIVGNAIKFTDEGKVELYSKEDKDNVIIEIRDTGIGIPEKLKGYIFDKFSRARRLGTKGESTTGLGMSIVKTIVEKHGGNIWLESEEGKGTVFFITLPKTEG